MFFSVLTALTVYAADPSPVTEPEPEVSSKKTGDGEPDYAKLRSTVRKYETSIMELEKSSGAYDDRIGEELISLGIAYKELGRYQKAVEVLNRALLINRATRGPDNPEQLPILKLIIDTYTSSGDWEALDEGYQLLYWTSRRVYAEDIPRLLDATYRIARWQLNAYLSEFDPIPYKHLLQAENLYQDALEILEEHYGRNDPRLIGALNGIAVSNYHIASHIFNSNTTDEMNEIQSSSIAVSVTYDIAPTLRWQPLDYTRLERRKVLRRIRDIYSANPELPVEDRVTALVNLGDWFLIYGWRNHALKNYRQAYRLLAETGSGTDRIKMLFGNPVRIPTLTMDYQNIQTNPGGEDESQYVRVSFEVNKLGCARNIRFIEESDPDRFMARKNAKEFLYSSMFRPKFDEGKPVKAENVVMKLSGHVLAHEDDRNLVNYDEFRGFISTKRCNRPGLR